MQPSLFEQAWTFFKSFFVFPGLTWDYALIGIGLAIVFGAAWLCSYWPPLFKRHWLWAVAAVSAFLTLAAVAFVQIPLQYWTGTAQLKIWSDETLMNMLMLAAVPQILLTGLVQEGAKMVPAVFWWWRSGKNIDPRLGLAIGAMAGAGFGVFESTWAHNQMFAAGWTWQVMDMGGYMALAGFWERFFVAGFHIAASALAVYGLAKGWGWQYWLIASVLHGVLNYSVLFMEKGIFTLQWLEIYVAVVALAVTAWALWLRWRKMEIAVSSQPSAVSLGEGGGAES